MNDFVLVITVLGLIILGQAIQHYLYVKGNQLEKEKYLTEISRLVKALISKNANEYVMTTAIDKVATEEKPPVEPDMIDPDSLTDDEFDSSLGIKRVAPKP